MNVVLDRFFSKVVWNGDEDECWAWEGNKTPKGYGIVRVEGEQMYVHRFAYEQFVGPISSGLHIDHLCRSRDCVNPNHLEPVTQAENNRRAAIFRTHCPQGHPYSGDNLYIPPSSAGRQCRTCHRNRERRRYQARKRLENP